MDKETFIQALLEMFPNSFTESNTQMWIEAYSAVLPDELDFQELFDDMLTNYTSTNYAPSTGFFKPYVDKQLTARKFAEKEAEYQHKEVKIKSPVDEANDQYFKEREELIKNDKPMTSPILSPLELLQERNNPYDYKGFFTESQMKLFKCYVGTITMENLRIKFWQQVCKIMKGDKKNELCRDLQKVC